MRRRVRLAAQDLTGVRWELVASEPRFAGLGVGHPLAARDELSVLELNYCIAPPSMTEYYARAGPGLGPAPRRRSAPDRARSA